MRLTSEQVHDIKTAVTKSFGTHPFKIFLYGSRLHDHLKGGDIDLLVLTDAAGVKIFREFLLALLVEIKKQPSIGDRKIDIKAITDEELKSVPFFKMVASEMVEL